MAKVIGESLNFQLDISPPKDGKMWGDPEVS
jgi:hypothetical protein